MMFQSAAFVTHASAKTASQDRVRLGGAVYDDSFHLGAASNACLAAVADGVGGSRDGAFAAGFVLNAMAGDRAPEISELLAINEGLIAAAATDHARRGSASTLLVAWLEGERLRMWYAGDSEAWLLRNELLVRINEVQRTGQSVLTSYLGGDVPTADISTECVVDELRPGDLLLLCSDGLLRCVERREIRGLLSRPEGLADRAKALYDAALTAERPDDASAVLVECHPNPESL